jgi:hypothetical protein
MIQKAMDVISSMYKLKDGSVKEPDFYLGADIQRWKINSCDDQIKLRWAMSSDAYVAEARGCQSGARTIASQ